MTNNKVLSEVHDTIANARDNVEKLSFELGAWQVYVIGESSQLLKAQHTLTRVIPSLDNLTERLVALRAKLASAKISTARTHSRIETIIARLEQIIVEIDGMDVQDIVTPLQLESLNIIKSLLKETNDDLHHCLDLLA